MVETKNNVQKISLSNTKKEMLEAFEIAKNNIEDNLAADIVPDKKAKEIISFADKISPEKHLQKISILKTELGNKLLEIGELFDEECKKYNKIKEAIEIKNAELEELFEIEKSAFNLMTMIELQNQKKIEFESQAKKLKFQFDKEQKFYFESLREQKIADEKLKKRQKEEFEYNFKREQELKKNKLNTELENQRKDLLKKKENVEKQLSLKEQEFKKRESFLNQNEEIFDHLQKKVDNFPQELENSVAKAVKESIESKETEFEKNKEISIKSFEGEKNVLKTKIESLETQDTINKKQIESLTKQLELAYNQIHSITMAAISKPTKQDSKNQVRKLK